MHQIFGYWKSNVIQRNYWSLLSQRVKTLWDRHGSQFVRIFISRAEVQQLYKSIYIYYGTYCIDAFFNNNITSVEEYVDIFFSMTKIKKLFVHIADTSLKFRVQKLPVVASCGNKGSVYARLCNASNLGDETRVIADGFVYKNKHCALCHGFEIYSNESLELVNCHTSVNIAGIEMTIPDESCTLPIIEGNGEGHMEEKVNVSVYFPQRNELNCFLRRCQFMFPFVFCANQRKIYKSILY